MVVIIDSQNAGISGNMVLGALIDLGVNADDVKRVIEDYASYFGDITVKINEIQKKGITSTYVDIKCQDKGSIKYRDLMSHLNIIEHSNITPDIMSLVNKIFKVLAEAEAKVHGKNLDDIHFHEVGAADAVADIIGTAYCYYKLKLNSQRVYGTPVALGGGRKDSSHGTMSIPAPATLEILKNVPIFGGPVEYELTTPTGAAILTSIVDEFHDFYPIITNKKAGYGAGSYELPFPNTLRILLGESLIEKDKVSILETNLDTVTGEVLGHSFNSLLNAGALDVTVIPTITKKNRPGHLLRVITKPEDSGTVSKVIMRETGTLGVRMLNYVHRNVADRKTIPIKLNIEGVDFQINIKIGLMGDEIISIAPEYEDVRYASEKTDISLKNMMKMANDEFKRILDENYMLQI